MPVTALLVTRPHEVGVGPGLGGPPGSRVAALTLRVVGWNGGERR